MIDDPNAFTDLEADLYAFRALKGPIRGRKAEALALKLKRHFPTIDTRVTKLLLMSRRILSEPLLKMNTQDFERLLVVQALEDHLLSATPPQGPAGDKASREAVQILGQYLDYGNFRIKHPAHDATLKYRELASFVGHSAASNLATHWFAQSPEAMQLAALLQTRKMPVSEDPKLRHLKGDNGYLIHKAIKALGGTTS